MPPATGAARSTGVFRRPCQRSPTAWRARFRALVKQIKANANYNASIGQALGIEGAHQTPPDLTSLQPVIDVAISRNQVFVDWGWGGNPPIWTCANPMPQQRRQGLWAAGL